MSVASIPRSSLDRLVAPGAFRWATGIEDTFITAPWPGSGRSLDEYELTGHYRRWREDLALMAELGVGAARYGIPWHRVNPAPRRWEWRWADAPLERLLELGIDPIVDLVHYGVPPWLEGAFLAADFPARMAEYAVRVAERFRGQVHWFTPLNEPRITAWYCGKLGWWPPARRGWRGFVEVLLAVCRGIVETCRGLHAVDPEIVLAHVDATDLYSAADPGLAREVLLREQLVFLALDLVSGSVGERHPLRAWLERHGASDDALGWFGERAVPVDVVGINLYPMFTDKRLVPSPRGLRVRMPYATPQILDRLARRYWRRYRRPVMVTETASLGTCARRLAWLEGSVATVRRLRSRGVPVVGYTWWPMFALVAWAYRQGRRGVHEYLLQMGLWDLARDRGLARVRTPLVDAYGAIVARGAGAVGALA
ncbi:MAG TPA: family 1 glycosylhydrolase [Candidatus Binatia bacterium]|nr:family 1 glycosylhydrolase [Candidatus Binatia bacterium]